MTPSPDTPPLPALGARLRRLRQLQRVKQDGVARLCGVSQGTVSRWESGVLQPPPAQVRRIFDALRGRPVQDAALKRLVETSPLHLHLVTDLDHELLAASGPRQRWWGTDTMPALLHTSLWRYATREIVEVEMRLEDLGWWEQPDPAPVRVPLSGREHAGLPIQAGVMVWERVWLASGLPARLCTTWPAAA